jgi:enamine deaminase RidA (YjgF/YER057c/UK114 family)
MTLPEGVAVRRFHGANGCDELYLEVEPPSASAHGFAAELRHVEARYAKALVALGVAPESAVFRRLFISDVLNQADLLRESALARDAEGSPVAISIVQQPPLSGGKVVLLAYHVVAESPVAKRRVSPHHVLVEHAGTRHLWSTGLCAAAHAGPADSAAQTQDVFDSLIAALGEFGGTLEGHCQRTWIYLKDVDVFYRDMVARRTAIFEHEGLDADSHYIASTGIEGACAHQFDVVAMDAYSNLDARPEQISYLNDFDHLCATKDYQVTFERGARLSFADRRHYFISGTASIDRAGRVVHRGDVHAQLGRALENVEALLSSGGAGLADMAYWIVYLRDRSDYEPVASTMRERFPGVPIVFVQGAVCRPEWLVEVEGVALTACDEPGLPVF